MIARIGLQLALLVAVGTTIGCDRVTKHIAITTLAGTPARSFLADTVRLQYVENTGGFLGLGADLPPATRTGLFTGVAGLTVLAVIGVALHRRITGWPLIGVAMFVAGGASNWIDRFLRGSVVDFLNIGVGPLRTGIFNLADVAIMMGVGIFALAELRRSHPDEGPPHQPQSLRS